jgi:hypothetical protein
VGRPDTKDTDLREVAEVLRVINKAWVEGRPDDVEEWVRDDIVMAFPGFEGRSEGGESFVEGYREFLSQASILAFRELDVSIDVWGETAVASYRFEIEYEMAGESHRDSGHDVFVFTREPEGWRAVWRTMMPEPTQPEAS